MRIEDDGDVTIDMGVATGPLLRAMPVVSVGQQSWNATAVNVPNPHAVVFLDELDELAALDLTKPPARGTARDVPRRRQRRVRRPLGAPSDRHVRMRVHERGVGETLSCGTGAVRGDGRRRRRATRLRPRPRTPSTSPEAHVVVTRRADEHIELRGPAQIVATATIGAAP